MIMVITNNKSFSWEEIVSIENVFVQLRQMISSPQGKENTEIMEKLVKAENIITERIDSTDNNNNKQQQQKQKDKNQLKGASIFTFPEAGIIFNDRYYGIKNLCKKFGLLR
jgi:hypothetical protein